VLAGASVRRLCSRCRTRHAAGRRHSVGADRRSARRAGREATAWFAGSAAGALERALGAGRTGSRAVVVAAAEATGAAATACAVAVGALPVALRVVSGALHVTRARHASELAGRAALTRARPIRAFARAIRARIAAHVARRAVTGKGALRLLAALAVSVRALAHARRVVGSALQMARRRNTAHDARVVGPAPARAVLADERRIVIAAQQPDRSERNRRKYPQHRNLEHHSGPAIGFRVAVRTVRGRDCQCTRGHLRIHERCARSRCTSAFRRGRSQPRGMC